MDSLTNIVNGRSSWNEDDEGSVPIRRDIDHFPLCTSSNIQRDVTVRIAITKNSAQSVSTQIGTLRAMLLGKVTGSDVMPSYRLHCSSLL